MSTDDLDSITREILDFAPTIEECKRLAGHGTCEGWSIGGGESRCGCGAPLEPILEAAQQATHRALS